MKTITIEGQLRTELGKGATRQLRSQGNVPGVIYGGEKEINFSAADIAFKPLVYIPDFQFAEIKLNDDTTREIMKEWQMVRVNVYLIQLDSLVMVEGNKVIEACTVELLV